MILHQRGTGALNRWRVHTLQRPAGMINDSTGPANDLTSGAAWATATDFRYINEGMRCSRSWDAGE